MKNNMKNFRYTIVILLTLIISCEDAIDITQPGRLTPDVAFETVEDLEDALNGVYARYDLTPEIALAAEYTDEVAVGVSSGGQGLNTGLAYNLNAGSAAAQVFWQNGYGELNAVNRLIAGAELVEPDNIADQEMKDNILGQAYALRAFSHFQLLSYYSTDLADDNALGVIIVDFVPTIDQQLLRSTNGEVFEVINSDLDKAMNLLSTESDPVYVSQDFVTALRARMAAYRENYTEAASYAQVLLDKYDLADQLEYVNMFLDQDNTEVIFKFERVLNDGYDGQGATGSVFAGGWAGARFAFTNATAGGGAYYEFDRSLFDLFDPNDIRYTVNLAPTSIVADDPESVENYIEDDVLIIQKYPGSSGQFLLNDLKVFRASEMLLILAEAKAAAGDFNGSTNSTASLIKELRDARFGTDQPLPNYANQTEAFAAILVERQIEFAFEGHRWKDIKRLGKRANQGAMRSPLDCSFNGACSLSPSDYRFTLPLPLVEFNGNPGLREQQNPGY